MSVQYNEALQKGKLVRSELDALKSKTVPTPSEIGSVSARLSLFEKSIREYENRAHLEIVPEKKTTALKRVEEFKGNVKEYREQIEGLKNAREEAQHQSNRAELLGRRPYNATPENPYANAQTAANPAFQPSAALQARGQLSTGSAEEMREAHAFREQNFFANTHSALDDYIARGQAVLGDLGQQREMLKNTQKRLYSVGNTLGISGDTIRMVERRARQDKWLFFGGVIVFFAFCWLVLHFLR